jgi:four helix bundle protein
MKKQKFRKLDIWDKSIDFIEEIYKITSAFPKEEAYGLTSQTRRAATSISLNIAEGSGASSDLEFKRFLGISLRSAYEVMCALEIAARLGYLDEAEKEGLLKSSDNLSAMISGLMGKLKADSR